MTNHPAVDELRRQLGPALERLYMGSNTFLTVFHETPDAALAVFKIDPAAFGRLRTYVGATSVKANQERVATLARRLHRLLTATHIR